VASPDLLALIRWIKTSAHRHGLYVGAHTLLHVLGSISAVHEMSVCQALLSQVAQIARQRGAGAVDRITVQIGPLSGVDPEQLRRAFEVMRAGGESAAAALVIETAAVEVRCLACGADSETAVNRLVCRACGGYRTRVIAGDELRLRSIELQM